MPLTTLDAMTDSSRASHDSSVTHQFPKLSETGTTAELLTLLDATRA